MLVRRSLEVLWAQKSGKNCEKRSNCEFYQKYLTEALDVSFQNYQTDLRSLCYPSTSSGARDLWNLCLPTTSSKTRAINFLLRSFLKLKRSLQPLPLLEVKGWPLESNSCEKLTSRASFWHISGVLLIKIRIWPFFTIFSWFLISHFDSCGKKLHFYVLSVYVW